MNYYMLFSGYIVLHILLIYLPHFTIYKNHILSQQRQDSPDQPFNFLIEKDSPSLQGN